MKFLNKVVGSVVLACASLLAVNNASASNVGPYVFGNVGAGFGSAASVDEEKNALSTRIQAARRSATMSHHNKTNSFIGELGAGYRFMPNMAGELSYQYLGKYSTSLAMTGGNVGGANSIDHAVKMQGLRVAVLGIYPVSSRFEVFGSLSGHLIQYRHTLGGSWQGNAISGTLKKTKLVPGVGVGATYKFTDNLYLRGQYEFIATKMNVPHEGVSRKAVGNTQLVKVGLVYQF